MLIHVLQALRRIELDAEGMEIGVVKSTSLLGQTEIGSHAIRFVMAVNDRIR